MKEKNDCLSSLWNFGTLFYEFLATDNKDIAELAEMSYVSFSLSLIITTGPSSFITLHIVALASDTWLGLHAYKVVSNL